MDSQNKYKILIRIWHTNHNSLPLKKLLNLNWRGKSESHKVIFSVKVILMKKGILKHGQRIRLITTNFFSFQMN